MVYRPPKKSPTAPRFPGQAASADPLSGPLSRAADGEEIMQGDDRNLVKVDESYAGGDFEDRLWLFWRRQKGNLLMAIGVIALGVIGWQGYKLYQQHAADQLEAAYQAAEGGPALLAFAQAHPDTTPGKLAQLEAADAFYKDGKFTDATKAYTAAVTIWGTENYGQRARIGLAMSMLQNNDATGAHQQLEALAKDTQSVAFYRSEAAFNLAVIEAQAGNQKNVQQWVDQIKALKDPTWINETTTFIDMLSSAPGSKITTTMASPAPAATASASPAPVVVKAATPATPVTATSKPAAPAAGTTKPVSSPGTTNSGFDLSGLKKAAGDTTSK